MSSTNELLQTAVLLDQKASDAESFTDRLVFTGISPDVRRRALEIRKRLAELITVIRNAMPGENGQDTGPVPTPLDANDISGELGFLAILLSKLWTELARMADENDEEAEEYWRTSDLITQEAEETQQEIEAVIHKDSEIDPEARPTPYPGDGKNLSAAIHPRLFRELKRRCRDQGWNPDRVIGAALLHYLENDDQRAEMFRRLQAVERGSRINVPSDDVDCFVADDQPGRDATTSNLPGNPTIGPDMESHHGDQEGSRKPRSA